MGQWVFAEIQGADVRRAPQEAELFKSDQAQEGEYAGTDQLVREVIQNSLDASSEDGPVRVRIALHEAVDAPPPDRLSYYFDRLRAPLAAKKIEFDPRDSERFPCRFIVCEDFGTRGLEGDVRRHTDPPNRNGREDFYWFWRNIGLSGKTGNELGRWGLGKLVYRAASRAGCMLGLTIRQSDCKSLLMGQSVIRVHSFQGKECQPEGFWCGESTPIPLPIEDKAELGKFHDEWKLSRGEEPGLSVVAPFVHAELKADRIVQAVAVNFLARILRGELVVEVVGTELGLIVLDQMSLEAACKRVEWNGPKRMKRHEPPPIAFVRKCLDVHPARETELLGTKKVPDLNENSLPADALTELRRRFASGQLTSLRVRMSLPRLSGAAAEGAFDVHVQRDTGATSHDSYFVREGMTITRINSTASRKGIRGLVIVEAGPLAELLGDTEGPSHEDWLTSADRPNQCWKTWKGRVTFVRKIVDSFVELLTPPTTEPDFDLLADFFSIEQTAGEQKKPRGGENGDTNGHGEIDFPPPSAPKWFQITERAGGFTVSRTANVPLPPTPALRVSVAYDLSRGDPLRSWSPYDFEVSDDGNLRATGSGVRARKAQGNVVTLEIENEQFKFKLAGFDPNRDLYVRVDDISDEPDEEAEK